VSDLMANDPPTAVSMTPILRSPLMPTHRSHGAMTQIDDGAEVVRSYGDTDAERVVLTGTVGVADVTVRAKIDLRGQIVGHRDGQTNKLVDELVDPEAGDVVARIAEDWALVFAPPGPVTARVDAMAARAGHEAMVTDVTHLYAGFALVGPALPDAIARLTSWDPATLEPGDAMSAPIADIRAILVRRQMALPVLEIFVAMEFARYAWRSISNVVEHVGGGPIGWDALHEQGWR
jgi:glycine cleavage system aminomethyltransferase T